MKTFMIYATMLFVVLCIILVDDVRKDVKTLVRASVTDEVTPAVESAKEGFTFGNLLDAIEWVESGGQAGMMGDAEPIVLERRIGATAEINYRAIGAYQIHKIYVDDVNRILGENKYTYEDRWDKTKSREMFTIYTAHYKHIAQHKPDRYYTTMQSFEYRARIHNGGPNGWKKESTLPYWEKVKAYMERPVE